MMRPAVLASLTRSGRVESIHRGAVAVVDAEGRQLAFAGAPDQPCYYRSSCKPIQLLPALDAGVVDAFGLDDRHVAVMIASHSGAPRHVGAVREILSAIGLTPDALGCGYHAPRNLDSFREILAGAPASPLYNNCSGKHAGMLALSILLDASPEGYLDPQHPAQRRIVERVAEYAGITAAEATLGTDGCSAPTLYAPLGAMARAFARFAREMAAPGAGAWRIAQAVSRRADMLGEEDSFQVVLEQEMGDRILGKYGAEGLFCVAVRDAGLGIAVRVEDGGPRAIGPIVLDVLLQLGAVREDELGELMAFREPVLKNWRGTEIGTIRASAVLTRETSDARS